MDFLDYFICIYSIFISATITQIYMMSSSNGMWLKRFEIVLQVVNSPDQRNDSTFTWIKVTVHSPRLFHGHSALCWNSVHNVCSIYYSTCNSGVKTKGTYISPHNNLMAGIWHFWHFELFLAHTMKLLPPTNSGPYPSWLVGPQNSTTPLEHMEKIFF
jgi:hypothetical protein